MHALSDSKGKKRLCSSYFKKIALRGKMDGVLLTKKDQTLYQDGMYVSWQEEMVKMEITQARHRNVCAMKSQLDIPDTINLLNYVRN